jgi:hypothetical protein
MSIARLVAFLGVFFLLTALSHIYLYRRLFRDPAWRSGVRRAGVAFLLGMALIMLGGLVANRLLGRVGGSWTGYLIYGWMGVLGLAVPLLIAVDVLRLPLKLVGRARPATPLDPQRRLALTRGVAVLSGLGAASAATKAVATATDPPELREIDVPIVGLPEALDGFRIAQLSDVHIGPTLDRVFLEGVVARVNALKPDLVALTGDLVDGSVEGLRADTAPFGDLKSRHGTFFCTGNHEYYSGADPWCAEFTRLGIKVLRNAREELQHDGARLDVLGVDDWSTRSQPDTGHSPDRACEGRDRQVTGIMLAHQPRSIDDCARVGMDLVLSGHTHGGQMWPARWIVKLVQPYVEGLHRHSERTWIYVHTGTGYWGPPMRLGVRAEIALLTLRRAPATA